MTNATWLAGFAQRLDILLRELGVSKAEMARRCGLPPRTLENYFKGHKPGVEQLIAISRGLRVDVDWLLGDMEWERGRIQDLVTEAAWGGVRSYAKMMIRAAEAGEIVVGDGRILGMGPDEFATKVANNIRQKYVALQYFAATESSESLGGASRLDRDNSGKD